MLKSLAVLAIFLAYSYGLECYTGFSVIRGKTVGTDTKTCSSPSDKCYKANADLSTITKLKLAGCSTYRCMLSPNGCMTQMIAGESFELCCCNSDLCNAPESNVESIAKGLLTHFSGNNEGGSSNNGGFIDTIKNAFSGSNSHSESNGNNENGLTNTFKNALSNFGR